MSDTPILGFPEAARRLGVPLRVLRRAIRRGRLPAPPQQGATASVPSEWLDSAIAAVAAKPEALTRAVKQKAPPFARYKGTSAWRKYPNRVREHTHFQAAARRADGP